VTAFQHLATVKLTKRLAGAARFETRQVDVEAACRRYVEEGYEVTGQLRTFLDNYGELTITWPYRQGETFLKVAVEDALDVPNRNVRIYGRRIGQNLLPVGMAFSTEEAVLLADSGAIFFGGDAGMQRVAKNFETAVTNLVADNWDKTFF
jgi:hypothetical protein